MQRLGKAVPLDALDITTKTIIEDMRSYFEESGAESIGMDPFFVYFCMRHPTLTTKQRELYRERLSDALTGEADPALERGILGRLVQAEAANNVATLLEKWNAGAEIELYSALRSEVEALELALEKKGELPEVEEDIDDILKEDMVDGGLHWRLECLNFCMRPLRGGDFVILAARPDKGKSSFIASEVTYMGPQFDTYYGQGHERSAVILCNEGPGKRIMQRVYQAALGATVPELIDKSQRGVLKDEYTEAVGSLNRIRVMNIHDMFNYDVEGILKRTRPGLVVMDMIDGIKFGGHVANGGMRKDEILEAQYAWARLMAVKYDCPIIATSQISADGDGLSFPTLSMLANSKTGKQGTADAIITVGALNDPNFDGSRFIGLTKNKLSRAGAPQSPRAEVLFDGARSRYSMPEA